MASLSKLTHNQETVLDALARAGAPLSAYQVLDDATVQSAGIKAPLTVYRAVNSLIAKGLVHRIESLNAFVVCNHGPHSDPAAFMICTACRKTIEVGTADVQEAVSRQAAKRGFVVEQLQVEVSGTCEACAR